MILAQVGYYILTSATCFTCPRTGAWRGSVQVPGPPLANRLPTLGVAPQRSPPNSGLFRAGGSAVEILLAASSAGIYRKIYGYGHPTGPIAA